MCYRAEYVYLILPGIVLLFLNLYTDILNTKLIKIIPFIIGISILIYNISLANYSTKVHRYTRQEDFKEGKIISITTLTLTTLYFIIKRKTYTKKRKNK